MKYPISCNLVNKDEAMNQIAINWQKGTIVQTNEKTKINWYEFWFVAY